MTDGQHIPLRGRWLIQASAGTGKTHTIGSLTLRLLIGQQGDAGEICTPLELPEILIVTFTNAAVTELRERTQQRLLEASRAFAGRVSEQRLPDDPFLQQITQRSWEHGLLERDLKQLEAAIARIDEMSVLTIHSFCHRLLQEAVFESPLHNNLKIDFNHKPHLRRALLDFLRQVFFNCAEPEQLLLLSFFESLKKGQAQLEALFGKGEVQIRGASKGAPPEMAGYLQHFHGAIEALKQTLSKVKSAWRDEAVRRRLEDSNLTTRQGTAASKACLACMAQWVAGEDWLICQDSEQGRTQDILKQLALYQRKTLLDSNNHNKKGEPPRGIDQFLDVIEAALVVGRRMEADFFKQAIHFTQISVHIHQQETGSIGLSAVIHQTAKLIKKHKDGHLTRQLRQKYPVALIDEFQDTDPDQWSIFSNIYADVHSQTDALVLIGDPKQAIYAFRGADLNTYLAARRSVPGAQMIDADVNWRSSPAVLESIETLYTQSADPFANDEIHFQKVRARPEASTNGLSVNRQAVPALNIWSFDAKGMKVGELRKQQATIATKTLTHLLHQGAQLTDRALKPQDVTFLVNDKTEAKVMQTLLKQSGFASVWRSRESVFTSEAAAVMYRLVCGIIAPEEFAMLASALTCPLLQVPLAVQGDAEGNTEREAHLERFMAYRRLWYRKGFIAAWQQLLLDYRIASLALAKLADGHRLLTDLRQLGEILQQKTEELNSLHLVRLWLFQQMETDDDGIEAYTLRLESDENLIKIMTLHNAKGLEFDLVMIPFGVKQKKGASNRPIFLRQQTQNGAPIEYILRPQAADLALGRAEALSEGLRLLYVSLTRAKFGCYIGYAKHLHARIQRASTDVLDALLDGDQNVPAKIEAAFKALAKKSPQIEVIDDFEALYKSIESVADLDPAEPKAGWARARAITQVVDRNWRLMSYSGLKGQAMDIAQITAYQDESQAVEAQAESEAGSLHPMAHQFPRGAHAGSCLHSLLECPPQSPPPEMAAYLRQTLARYGIQGRWQEADLLDWLKVIRSTPLAAAGCSLQDVNPNLSRAEMHFYLPITPSTTDALNAILRQYDYVSTPLSTKQLGGMLQGVIDLTFESQGRYWIADYKSNWLGGNLQDYSKPQMHRAVCLGRYDMQLLFYTLAIRRLLQLHLGKAQARRAFGGAFCLFLRGMNGRGEGGVYTHQPDEQVIQALDDFFGGHD